MIAFVDMYSRVEYMTDREGVRKPGPAMYSHNPAKNYHAKYAAALIRRLAPEVVIGLGKVPRQSCHRRFSPVQPDGSFDIQNRKVSSGPVSSACEAYKIKLIHRQSQSFFIHH